MAAPRTRRQAQAALATATEKTNEVVQNGATSVAQKAELEDEDEGNYLKENIFAFVPNQIGQRPTCLQSLPRHC